MFWPLIVILEVLVVVKSALAYQPIQVQVIPRQQNNIFSQSRITTSLSASIDDIFHDSDYQQLPQGCVSNITQWLIWSDKSLQNLSEDGKGGIYDRINAILQQENGDYNEEVQRIANPQQIHNSNRFAILSHGNQTDPVYNYVC